MEKQTNIPKLRFPEFKGEWEKKKLGEILKRYSIINKDEEFKIKDILSLSSTLGIVKRNELMDGVYDKVNHKNYIKTSINDIIYGKSISSKYPFGLFKANNCADGLLSTLYFTFKVHEDNLPNFLDYYFNYDNRANNFLRQFVLVGDRYITADANYILSGSIFFPTLPEQTKIAEFFTAIDAKIQALKTKKQLLHQYKKGVMLQLFSQEWRFKDENGKDYPKWKLKKLGEVFYSEKGKGISKNKIIDNGKFECVLYGELYTKYNEVIFEILSKTNENDGIKSKIGDLLIPSSTTTTGIDLANVTALNKDNVLLGGDITVLRSNEPINNIFYSYYLSNHKKNEIASYAQGSTIVHLYYSHIKDMCIDLPSLSEQTAIANFLTSLDEKINHTETQIQQTQIWKKGLLQKMFV